jgi:hypothetical protein
MNFIIIGLLFVVVAAMGVFADDSTAQAINSMFHLSGIASMLVVAVFSSGVTHWIWSAVTRKSKLAKDGTNLVESIVDLVEQLKKNATDQEKVDVNNGLDDIMDIMGDIKFLAPGIPKIQALKMKIDTVAASVAPTPAMQPPTPSAAGASNNASVG